MDFTSPTYALNLAVNLWKKLEISGASNKNKALKKLGVYKLMETACPLCEYGNTVSRLNGTTKCRECRKIFTWNCEGNHCTDPESYYQKWVEASDADGRKFWAGKMVELTKYNLNERRDI